MKNQQPSIDAERSAAAAIMGRKGGKNGTGASKTRSPEHYRKLAAARQAARLRRLSEAK